MSFPTTPIPLPTVGDRLIRLGPPGRGLDRRGRGVPDRRSRRGRSGCSDEGCRKANIDAVAEAHKSTLAANENSQNHCYKASQDQRDALRADLGRDDLRWAEREALHDRLERNVHQVYEKDSESKQFLWTGTKVVATATTAALALGVVFVGSKIAGASEDGSEESQ